MPKRTRRSPARGKTKKETALPVVVKPDASPSARNAIAGIDLATLDFIEKAWPGIPPSNVREAFVELRAALAKIAPPTAPAAAWPPAEGGRARHFDVLDLVRRILAAHDLLFLSRQVTYHVATSADLPMAWADVGQMQFVFSQIIEHLVRRAARASRISIGLAPFALRSGPGLEVAFSSTDRHVGDADRNAFLAELFQERVDEVSGVSLSDCRQVVARQHGQLWVDFPKPNRPAYHLALPLSQEAQAQAAPAQQTFKYDISISNYADVRKRFGIRKSHSLVTQIEHYVRSLVRYPIDVVMALGDKGIITTIYETQRGTAQSVASRISQRLGAETFRIGKRAVEIAFSYHLSPLSPSTAKRPEHSAKPQSH